MSAKIVSEPGSVLQFLFGDDGRQSERLMDVWTGDGTKNARASALGPLGVAARHVAAEGFASAVDSLVGFDLMDLVAAGWRKHVALEAAAERTRADPSTEETVDLASHKIVSVQRPTIDVMVDGVKAVTIPLELSFEGLIHGAIATVRNGRLVAVRYGICDATVTLSVDGVEVAKRDGRLDLDLGTHLNPSIDLLPGSAEVSDPTIHLPDS